MLWFKPMVLFGKGGEVVETQLGKWRVGEETSIVDRKDKWEKGKTREEKEKMRKRKKL